MMDKKDQILLAKEIYTELFDEMSEEMQEQIKQLWEPISQDDAGDAPLPNALIDRVEKFEKLLKRVDAWFRANHTDIYYDEDTMRLWSDIESELKNWN